MLERQVEGGKLRKQIKVEAARELPEFFSRSPGMADYRVAIVDSVDDLNEFGGNALLKTLEAPPSRGVLFLISHAPGALLPTIRSRCRRLAFPPWSEADVAAFVHDRTGAAQERAHQAAALAGGGPGRALAALDNGGLELDAIAADLVNALPQVDEPALLALAERFRGGEGLDRFLTFFQRLGGHVQDRAKHAATSRQAARWASEWSEAARRAEAAEAVNLDRTDVLWTTVAALRRVAAS